MLSNTIKTSGFSLAKRRELQGDDYYATKSVGDLTIAVVCDGVGSAQEGAQAAQRTCNYLINNFTIRPKSWSIEKSIRNFINSFNAILFQESQVNYQRSELVTTLALVVIQGERLYGANVGDSRIYLQREGKMLQLSQDHVLKEKGYENVLTHAMGIDKSVTPYYFENIIQKDDKILLCSDGLYNLLCNEVLESSLYLGARNLVKKASTLTEDDLPDDTTAVVLEVENLDETSQLKAQNLPILEVLKKGDNVDGYTLLESLIQNNRTWLCEKKNKKYVLKFAPLQVADDDTQLDLFVKEAWNAKRLKSDYFPKAVIPKNRTSRYYVMEYIEAQTLASFLKTRPLGVEDAISLAKILLGMESYLLQHDLVHGDIKPENIMVLQDANKKLDFKVIDFGSITEIFSNTSKAGTPSFLAPERFQNSAISEGSEIFAIGVTLYFALTQKYPYGEIEPFQSPNFKNAKKPSHFNAALPDWVESIILRAIAATPVQRYEHYSEMLFELQTPQKVKPYFNENVSFIERSPLLFYRIGFTVMTLLNMVLTIMLLR